jgi:hypothetical protein
MSSKVQPDRNPAPAGQNAAGSKIAVVRTKHQWRADDAIEVRLPRWLKLEVKQKAKKDGCTISQLVVRQLAEYIGGPIVGGTQRTVAGRRVRGIQGTEFRRMQVEQLGLLRDLERLARTETGSPLAAEAAVKLLTECTALSRATFNLLARHVP